MSMNLTESVSDLVDTRVFEAQAYPGLYPTMLVLLADRLPRTDESERTGAKVFQSTPPLNGVAFLWVTDLEALARTSEAELRTELGFTVVPSSATRVATIRTLRRLPELAQAVHGRKALASARHDDGGRVVGCSCPGCTVARSVARLVVRAQEILGEVEPWARYTKSDGTEEPCWVCGNKSLRVRRTARVLRCVFPGCCSEWDTDNLEFVAADYAGEAS